MNTSTPSRRPAGAPRTHYALAESAPEWIAAIAEITAADRRGEPRPDPDSLEARRAVDANGVRIHDLYSPANMRLTGRKEASDLLAAAWDAQILTGPYPPTLLLLANGMHTIALAPDLDLPLLTAHPETHTQLVGDTEPGPPAALAFLRRIVTRANTLLNNVDHYLDLCTSAAEEAARAAEQFLAEQDVTPHSSPAPATEPPSTGQYAQALWHLDRLTTAVHLAGVASPANTPFHPARAQTRPTVPGPTGPGERADTEVITLDQNTRAFYQGVVAGARAVDDLSRAVTGEPDTDHSTRSAYFWFRVGIQLQQTRPGAGDQEQAAFVRGAALRAPEPTEPHFLLRIDQTPDADPPDTDSPGGDAAHLDMRARPLISALLRACVDVSAGVTSGNVVNDTGKVIGTFQLWTPLEPVAWEGQ